MATIDADVLVELLDRQFAFLREQSSPHRRLLLLPRLLNFVETEPTLWGIAAELRDEATARCREFGARDRRLRAELLALWVEHQCEIRSSLEPYMARGHVHAHCHLDSYERELGKSPSFSPTELTGVADGRTKNTEALIDAFVNWAGYLPKAGEGPEGERYEALRVHLNALANAYEYDCCRLSDLSRHHAGFAFQRLRDVATRATPEPPSELDDDSTWLLFQVGAMFATAVRSPRRANVAPGIAREVELVIERTQRDLHLLHEELRERVLLGRSRIALVRRYAARCAAFDAERLRGVAAGKTGRAEQNLTLDFARFLFDQGLNPLIDPNIGRLKPDILDLGRSALFYVEAKQYGDDLRKAGVRSAMLKAWRQIWSTWSRLLSQHHVPEAFLVVFRRGGPPAAFPTVVRHRGLRLYPVLIDIAEDVGSSESYAPVEIKEEDLLPDSPDTTTRRAEAPSHSATARPAATTAAPSTASNAGAPAGSRRATPRSSAKASSKAGAGKAPRARLAGSTELHRFAPPGLLGACAAGGWPSGVRAIRLLDVP